MKASDLDRARTLLSKLATMRQNVERLGEVPDRIDEVIVTFTYEDEDGREVQAEFDLTSGEEAPVREQVHGLLNARVQNIVGQLTELGVDPDA